MPKTVSVLICVDDDKPGLSAAHHETLAELATLEASVEFLYLVGHASENTLGQLRDLHQEDPERVRVIRFAGSVGGAARLTAGVERARGELVLTLPAPPEVEVEALRELWASLAEGADLAFASRHLGPSARLQSRLFSALLSRAAGTRFSDIGSQTRLMRREVLAEVPLYGDFHRYLPVLVERLGFAVREVPARQRPGTGPPRIYAPRLYLWRAMDVLSIFFLSRFTRRPLRLFGGVGSLFGLVGAAIVATLGVERLFGHPLAERPLLVLGTLLLAMGVQMLTIGLLGELILFFQAGRIRDYRIASIDEAETPPLPPGERGDAHE